MKAVGVTEFGGPEVLAILDVPTPVAGPGEVRIRVHDATVNPTDIGLRAGVPAARPPGSVPPYIGGREAAGRLDQIGEGVAMDPAVGDRVIAIAYRAQAEYVVVPAASVVRAPANATDAEAATLPMNGLTARQALDLLALRPGQTLAVTGAAGAVGGYAIQLAKADGLQVIADASAADEDLVRGLGADIVIPRGDGFVAQLLAIHPGGVDGLVDAAVLDDKVIDAVADGGGIATFRGFQGSPERGITYHPVAVRHYGEDHEKLDRLRQQVEAGLLTLRVARVFPAEQAADAHRLLEAGGTRGRIVLEF